MSRYNQSSKNVRIKKMHKDEMEILRAASAKLDPETIFVMTYQYHTEKDPDDP